MLQIRPLTLCSKTVVTNLNCVQEPAGQPTVILDPNFREVILSYF